MLVVLLNNVEFLISIGVAAVLFYKLGRRVERWGWRGAFKSHKLPRTT